MKKYITQLFVSSLCVMSAAQSSDLINNNERMSCQQLNLLLDQLERFNPSRISSSHDAFKIAQEWIEFRVKLRNDLDFYNQNCPLVYRAYIQYSKYNEEVLLERKEESLSTLQFKKQKIPLKETASYYNTINLSPEIGFKDGDILITKGVSYLSSLISKVTQENSVMSHTVFVSVAESGETHTIESYVGSGVKKYNIDTALRNENVRISQFRLKNFNVSKKASRWISQELKSRSIPYDYNLDFDDSVEMSCAEVSRVSYYQATDGRLVIPSHESHFKQGLEFLSSMGLTSGARTYAPADLEFDERFDPVTEWRDLRLTRQSRQKDAVIEVILNAIKNHQLSLKPNASSFIASRVLRAIDGRYPLLAKALTFLGLPHISSDVPRDVITQMALLSGVADRVYQQLQINDRDYELSSGWPMTYQQLLNNAESLL